MGGKERVFQSAIGGGRIFVLAVCGAGLRAQDNNSDTEYSGIYPGLLSLSLHPPLFGERKKESNAFLGSIAVVLVATK